MKPACSTDPGSDDRRPPPARLADAADRRRGPGTRCATPPGATWCSRSRWCCGRWRGPRRRPTCGPSTGARPRGRRPLPAGVRHPGGPGPLASTAAAWWRTRGRCRPICWGWARSGPRWLRSGAPVAPDTAVDVNLLRDWGEWAAVVGVRGGVRARRDGPRRRRPAAGLAHPVVVAGGAAGVGVGPGRDAGRASPSTRRCPGAGPRCWAGWSGRRRGGPRARGLLVGAGRPDPPGRRARASRWSWPGWTPTPGSRSGWTCRRTSPSTRRPSWRRCRPWPTTPPFPATPTRLSVADRLAACSGWVRDDVWDQIQRRLGPGRRGPGRAGAGLHRPAPADGAELGRRPGGCRTSPAGSHGPATLDDVTTAGARRAGCSARTCSRRRSGPRRTRTCSSASCWWAWTKPPGGATCSGSSTSPTAASTASRAGPNGWPARCWPTTSGARPGCTPRTSRTGAPTGWPTAAASATWPRRRAGVGAVRSGVPQAQEPAQPVLGGGGPDRRGLRLPGRAHGRPPGGQAAQRGDGRRLRGRHPRLQPGHPHRHLRHHRHGQVQPDASARRRGHAGQRPLRAARHRSRTASTAPPWPAIRGPSQSLRVYANRSLPGSSALRISLAELTVDDLRTAYDWSRPQEEALYELERHFDSEGLAWLADFRPHRGPARFPRRRALIAGGAQHLAGGPPAGPAHRRAALRRHRSGRVGRRPASSTTCWPGRWCWST